MNESTKRQKRYLLKGLDPKTGRKLNLRDNQNVVVSNKELKELCSTLSKPGYIITAACIDVSEPKKYFKNGKLWK